MSSAERVHDEQQPRRVTGRRGRAARARAGRSGRGRSRCRRRTTSAPAGTRSGPRSWSGGTRAPTARSRRAPPRARAAGRACRRTARREAAGRARSARGTSATVAAKQAIATEHPQVTRAARSCRRTADAAARGRCRHDGAGMRRPAFRTRSALPATLALLALGGCGSTAPADLPAARPPPRNADRPARRASVRASGRPRTTADRRRRPPTCRESVDVTLLDNDRRLAVLCGRERVVEAVRRAHAQGSRHGAGRHGPGPDRLRRPRDPLRHRPVGESLLVYHLHPRFELIRRVNLPGGPYAIAHEPRRLRITLSKPREPRRCVRRTVPTTPATRSSGADG